MLQIDSMNKLSRFVLRTC